VLIDGVGGDDRVERGRTLVFLRTQNPSEALSLLLPGSEGSGDLDRHRGGRQIHGEVRDLRDDEHRDLPGPELAEELLAHRFRGLPGEHGRTEFGSDLLELVEILTDDEDLRIRMIGDELGDDRQLRIRCRSQPVPVLTVGAGIRGSGSAVEADADFMAGRRSDIAEPFEFLPRHLVLLGPDEGEHLVLASVLTHQRRGQPRRRRACRLAVSRKIGAGSRCTSS
jgi:hypothetical protein